LKDSIYALSTLNPPPSPPFRRCFSIRQNGIEKVQEYYNKNWMEKMQANLQEKTFVVTGATSGIGLATAEILVRYGASLIGVGRSAERCRQVEKSLRVLNPDVKVNYVAADLSLQREVRSLAVKIDDILFQHDTTALDGLVNNAGTYAYWFTLTDEGIEMQWAVNHLAPFLLTHLLMNLLHAAPQARVVTVSSDSHYGAHINWDDPQLRRRYNGLRAYENTKLANILFTRELNHRLGKQAAVRAFAADPGLVKTDIGYKGTPPLVRWVWKLRRSGGISAEEAGKGVAFLIAEPSIHDSPEIYWKHGSPKQASRAAQNISSASRLWLLSSQMCGMEGEG
jgi:retinol dehydrogenase 12